MWRRRALVRFTLPVLSANKNLLSSRPQLQSNKVLQLGEEIACTLGEDISRIPSITRSTMRHLSSRHREVSQWQAQISESIGRVDREITAVELVKDPAGCCLQEKQLYSQLMSDCVALCNILSSALPRQDLVLLELKREEQLTNEIREQLQKQICILLDKLSSLKEIRTQLLAGFQDKGESIKLTTKCITQDLKTSSSRLPARQYKPKYLKNAQERQCLSTDNALWKKINELCRSRDTLIWERQQIRDELSDQTADIQRVVGQIRNCDSKLHLATHRLDILNQRPRRELCLDQPHISLTLEKHDLAKMAAGLRPILMCSQQDVELTRRRLMIVEDKLAKNARALELEQKCRDLHQSFLPALDTTVVLANKARLSTAVGRSSAPSYLQ